MVRKIIIALLFVGLGYWLYTKPSYKAFSFRGKTMGTTYMVSAWGDSDISPRKINTAVDTTLRDINMQVSTWVTESQISLFNTTKTTKSMPASPFFVKMVALSKGIFHKSEGALDITIAPLIDLWGFDVKGRIINRPSEKAIAGFRKNNGMQYIKIDIAGNQIRKKKPEIKINVSAIAKGGAVDAIASLLQEKGIENYLIEIGGEIIASGAKIDGGDWTVGIEKPLAYNDIRKNRIIRKLPLKNMAIATSGDYRNYFEEKGVRYSHILNPKTGMPISHKLASVSVVATSAAVADGWSTALFVLGPKKALRIAEKHNIAGYFIVYDKDQFTVVKTSQWRKIFE